jgi:4'-phosphopantetheinyl transferase
MRLWLIDTRAERGDLRLLSDDERHRAARFRFDDDRHRFAVARARLRAALAEVLGEDPAALQFGAGPHGKPFVIGHRVEFNLSHSGDLVAIAVAEEPLGIDVEHIVAARANRGVAERWFSAAERAWMDAQPNRERAFFRLWTIKESAMKADGGGLSIPLDEVQVDPSLTVVRVRGREWRVRELDVDGYAAALTQ